MKKINIIALSFIFSLITISFVSCDTESVDSALSENFVGKSELSLTVKDSVYYRNDTKAYLTPEGSISFMVGNLGKARAKGDLGQDIFELNLATFSQAKFPFNADGLNKNIASYSMDAVGISFESFHTINQKSPNSGRSGIFTISKIDYKNNVFSGEFDLVMHPDFGNTKNTELIKVSGSFRDIPFSRIGIDGSPQFMYVEVDGKPMNELLVSAKTILVEEPGIDAEEGVVIGTVSKKYTQVTTKSLDFDLFDLGISFPEDIEVGVDHTRGYTVSYISKYGEKYTNSNNLLDGSVLNIVSVVQQDRNIIITGRYNFNLRNNDNNKTATLKKGDFVVIKEAK